MKKYINADTESNSEIDISWAYLQFHGALNRFTHELVSQFVDLKHLNNKDHSVWNYTTETLVDELWDMIEPHLQANDKFVTYTENNPKLKRHDSYL